MTMTNQMLLAAIQPDEQIYFITSKVDGLDGVVVRREEVVHVPFWTYISNNAGAVTRLKGNDFLDVLWDGGQAIKSDEWNEKFINRTNPFTKDDLKSVANLLLDVPKERKQKIQEDLSEFEKKSLDEGVSFKSPRSPLKMEPYDPDARDGDNDGIVQENTPWERPAATRLMDAAGKLIERGKESSSRPSGIRVIDADGNDVDYTPTYERSRAGTIGAGRQLGGSTSKPDAKPEPKKPVVDKPTQEKPEVKPKKPGSGTALSDHGSGSLKERGLRDVRAAAAPPPPPEPPKPEPKKPDAPKPDVPEGDYRMTHQPSDDGPRAFDLTEDGGGDWSMPSDVYDNPHLYTGADATVRKETMEQLERVRGNPDGLVTVYRYAPEGREFEVGNWVSLSRTYAEQHGASNPTPGGTVQSMQVPAREVRFAGDDLAEFGWHPEPVKPEPKKGSIDEARTGEPIVIVGMRQDGAQVETELTQEARDAIGRDALFGPGLYFTDDEAYLPAAGKRQDLTVTLQNPYVIDLEEIDPDQYEDMEGVWADVASSLPNPELLQRLGHDGIIARGGPIVGEDIHQAVVFPEAVDAAVKIEKPEKPEPEKPKAPKPDVPDAKKAVKADIKPGIGDDMDGDDSGEQGAALNEKILQDRADADDSWRNLTVTTPSGEKVTIKRNFSPDDGIPVVDPVNAMLPEIKMQNAREVGALLAEKMSIDELNGFDWKRQQNGAPMRVVMFDSYGRIHLRSLDRGYVPQGMTVVDPSSDNYKELFAEAIASQIIESWADMGPGFEEMQESASRVFGTGRRSPIEVQAKREKVIDAAIEAMYENTQRRFREQGITEVILHRGMSFDSPNNSRLSKLIFGRGVGSHSEAVDISLRPLSSFSFNRDTAAYSFGELGENGGSVMTSRVPVERILSLATTGAGCYDEDEAIVIGGGSISTNLEWTITK